MDRIALFNLLQFAATSYAVTRGGGPERLVGSAMLAATLMTRVAQSEMATRFAGIEFGVFAIDAALLVALLYVAVHADRYWTMWMAALHALGTGAHLVRLVDEDVLRFVYALLTAAWSYPMIALLVAGTFRHRRRLREDGRDLDWSIQGDRFA